MVDARELLSLLAHRTRVPTNHPEDLSPPSLTLQSLSARSSFPTPDSQHSPSVLWMGRYSKREEQSVGRLRYANGSKEAKAVRVWGFPGPRATRGANLRSREQRVSQDHPQKGETEELMSCVPCRKRQPRNG